MNQIILKAVLENKENFVPCIISRRQMEVIEKVLANKKLTRTEYSYLYNGIKKKVMALNLITEKKPSLYFYNSWNMIPKSRQKAIEILSGLKAKGVNAFISGSFLFSGKFNDIDIFIISNRYREDYKGNLHYIYIKQKDLEKAQFQSAAKSCISNFEIALPPMKVKKPHLEEILTAYQEAVINILEGEEIKNLKWIIADYSLYNLRRLMDSHELNDEYARLVQRKDKIRLISGMIKELVMNNFNKQYIILKLNHYIEILNEDIRNIRLNDHLKIYRKAYREILDECRGTKK